MCMLKGDQFPDSGRVTVEWSVSVVNGERVVGWRYQSEPRLDGRLAVLLLDDVAREIEIDLPESN